MDQVASRLLRCVGNADARSRMRADLTLRPDSPPRGVVLATGERKPGGYSAQARAFWVTVPKGAVDLERLTEAQQQRHLLPFAMAAYVQWLAPALGPPVCPASGAMPGVAPAGGR